MPRANRHFLPGYARSATRLLIFWGEVYYAVLMLDNTVSWQENAGTPENVAWSDSCTGKNSHTSQSLWRTSK